MTDKEWESYYARTATMPPPERTFQFLERIPMQGCILDFGTGSGRWAAAFSRDRPDLIIDAIDMNINQALLLPECWSGEKISSSFQNFLPTKPYDAIWAFASLFFMNNSDLSACFHKLASALKNNGTIFFTMVDDCHAAHNAKFYGLSKNSIMNMTDKEGLAITTITLDKSTTYGDSRIIIPTYSVTAVRIR